ncbi:MAG TPA: hypothetical protein VD835_13200 [Pyrinomonadaceae bacterium]|nr:hypothetical protein [Pyrinomonadaceae bacterium]
MQPFVAGDGDGFIPRARARQRAKRLSDPGLGARVRSPALGIIRPERRQQD